MEHITGRVWKLGDNVDTDVIYPGKYLPIIDAPEMALHALEGYDPEFPGKMQEGDIIVAGANFGCGSSREQAATCLKAAGVQAVIAKSFARIFFRNAINQGLPAVECSEAVDHLKKALRWRSIFPKEKSESGHESLLSHRRPSLCSGFSKPAV